MPCLEVATAARAASGAPAASKRPMALQGVVSVFLIGASLLAPGIRGKPAGLTMPQYRHSLMHPPHERGELLCRNGRCPPSWSGVSLPAPELRRKPSKGWLCQVQAESGASAATK